MSHECPYASPMGKTAPKRVWAGKVSTWVTLAIVAYIGIQLGLSLQTAPPSPVQVLTKALTAAGGSDAVHYRGVWNADGVSQIVMGDARPTSGSESVAVGSDQFTMILADHVVYIEGNAAALRDELGLPAATASMNVGRWIWLSPTDGPYTSVGDDLTTSAALAQIVIAPFFTSSVHGERGTLLTRLTGRIPHGRFLTGSARLDLVPRSNLPTSYFAGGSSGGPWSNTIAFSRWGDEVPVKAPMGAIPFSSL